MNPRNDPPWKLIKPQASWNRHQLAAAEILNRRKARRNLIAAACYLEPNIYQPARHLLYIANILEEARKRNQRRIMLEAPPRHGKSHLASEIFPAWSLGLDPSEQFMLCSYAQTLSDTFSRNIRALVTSDRYRKLFGDKVQLSDDSAAIQKWTLQGYTRPTVLSVGVGGSPTGHGAKILLIDDPVGNMEQAESQTQRDMVYDWYTGTIYPRLEPDAVIILMMQRWHEDDLAGRLIKDQATGDQWVRISLPAIAGPNDPLGRGEGEALWPKRYPLTQLRTIEKVNPRSFMAKYQQMPRPAEGSLFKKSWFRIQDHTPFGLRWFRYYDLAYSMKDTGNNSASIAGAFGLDGTLYLRRGWADQMESPDLKRLIIRTMLNERETAHGVEQAMHGGAVVQDLRREPALVNISLRPIPVDKDKKVRATPVADRAEVGKVVFLKENQADDAWIAEFIEELCSFPYGALDDRVDAVSGVFAMVALQNNVLNVS